MRPAAAGTRRPHRRPRRRPQSRRPQARPRRRRRLRAAEPAAPPAQATGGTLRIRLLNDIINLDPPFIPAAADEIVDFGIFEGLIAYKPGTWDVVNQLAETFEPSADGLQFAFKLKEGIQFHGGYGELTAEDVKFSYERTAGLGKPAIDSPYKGDFSPALQEVQVDDTYSGVIILKERFAPIMASTLPVFSGWVVSKKAVEERGKDFATSPIGTGPYEFVEWKPKQQASVQALRGLRRRVQRLPRHRLGRDGLRSGRRGRGGQHRAGDRRAGLRRASAQRGQPLRGQRRLHRRQSHVTLDFNWIGMNIQSPNLTDINVRKAVRSAIDVPSILEAAFEGR